MPPIESRPYLAWMRLNSLAAWLMASSQRHFAPRIGDLGADHRLQDAVFVRGVAPGEAALHAGVAVIRLAVLEGHHANDVVALQFGLERAADAAIGARRNHAAIRRALFDHGFFEQAAGGARLHARAAGNAFRFDERLVAGGNLRRKAAAVDGQGEACPALRRRRARSANRRCTSRDRK